MNTNYINMSDFGSYETRPMRECPVCGKMFSPAPEHSYCIGNKQKLVCSYSCVRKWEKEPRQQRKPNHEPTRNPNGTAIPVRITETGQQFGSITECAKHLGVSYSCARKMLYYGNSHNGLHLEWVTE